MDSLLTLLNPDQLLETMMPLVMAGLIVCLLIQRKLTAERTRTHQEEVYRMNRERSEWRVSKQQHQAELSFLEEKIQHQQDVIDKLTRVSMPEFFHLN